jgi:hypothetical protein
VYGKLLGGDLPVAVSLQMGMQSFNELSSTHSFVGSIKFELTPTAEASLVWPGVAGRGVNEVLGVTASDRIEAMFLKAMAHVQS